MKPSSDPQTIAEIVEQSQAEIPGLLRRQGIPGLSIALVDRESILWQAGFGIADRGSQSPMTPQTLFSMQSCSKTFTATAVLLAVQEELLDLDRPMDVYLPGFHLQSRYDEFPERVITLRQMLSHRAGFTHEAPVGNNYAGDEAGGTFDEHVRSIRRGWLRFPVNQRYSYSNLGIDLAAYILQQVSGMPFAEYLRQKLFLPLGMEHSTFDFETFAAAADRATGHDIYYAAARKAAPRRVPMVGAGGLYICAADVARYIQFHLNRGRVDGKVVLREDLLDEMVTLPWPEDGQVDGYGLGLAVTRSQVPHVYDHTGGGFGFLSDMLWHPQAGTGIVVLTNCSSHSIQYSYSSGVLEKLSRLPAYRENIPAAAPFPAPPEPVAVAASRLAVLRGHYAARMPARLEVRDAREGGLEIKFRGLKEPRKLRFTSETEAVVVRGERLFHYRFTRDQAGRPLRLTRLDDGTVYDFDRGPDSAPAPVKAEWRRFLGGYVAWINGALPEVTRLQVRKSRLVLYKPLYRQLLTLDEFRPGLFFTATGEAVDFTGETPLVFGVPVRRLGSREALRGWLVLAGGWLRGMLLKFVK